MTEGSRGKFMKAVFGKDGETIGSSTAAALLAATFSGGDPTIGNNIAQESSKFQLKLNIVSFNLLGAVYTSEFAYESAYDSVYDLVPKVDCNQIWDQFFLKSVYKRL
jgi:hypothetical protein